MPGPERESAKPARYYKGDHKQRRTLHGKYRGTGTGNRQQERNLRRMGVVLTKPEEGAER